MIKIDLPDSVTLDLDSSNSQTAAQARKTKQLFQKVVSKASDFNAHDYHLLSHNCVTAVSNVLNIVDLGLLSGVMKVVPSSLDSNVKKVAKKDAFLESMLEECILGTVATDKTEDELDELYSPQTAAKVWREAMTSVDKIKGNKAQDLQLDMKAQMKSMRNSSDNTPELEQHPPSPP